MNEAKIKSRLISRLIFFKEVYFLSTLLSVFAIFYLLSGLSIKYKRGVPLEFLLISFIGISIYFGLKFKKNWVINIILIYSSFAVINLFLFSFQLSDQVSIIFYKLVGFIFLFFHVYQIYFFSSREVKILFKERGTPFF